MLETRGGTGLSRTIVSFEAIVAEALGVRTVENTCTVTRTREGTDVETAIDTGPAVVTEAGTVGTKALAGGFGAVVWARDRVQFAGQPRESRDAGAVSVDADAVV